MGNIWLKSKKEEQEENNSDKHLKKNMPSHIGVFILAHSRRIMNKFIECIDGFKNPYVYYGDTDSLYISGDNFELLKQHDYVGNDLGKGKNDYENGGIIWGLFLSPKVKYCLVLKDDFTLKEIKTFKGYQNTKVKIEDYLKLASGETIECKDIKKPWKRSIEEGVLIPNENDKMIKKFNANINIIKRQIADKDGIMYPYFDKPDVKLLNDIKEKYNYTDEELKSDFFSMDVDYYCIDE